MRIGVLAFDASRKDVHAACAWHTPHHDKVVGREIREAEGHLVGTALVFELGLCIHRDNLTEHRELLVRGVQRVDLASDPSLAGGFHFNLRGNQDTTCVDLAFRFNARAHLQIASCAAFEARLVVSRHLLSRHIEILWRDKACDQSFKFGLRTFVTSNAFLFLLHARCSECGAIGRCRTTHFNLVALGYCSRGKTNQRRIAVIDYLSPDVEFLRATVEARDHTTQLQRRRQCRHLLDVRGENHAVGIGQATHFHLIVLGKAVDVSRRRAFNHGTGIQLDTLTKHGDLQILYVDVGDHTFDIALHADLGRGASFVIRATSTRDADDLAHLHVVLKGGLAVL